MANTNDAHNGQGGTPDPGFNTIRNSSIDKRQKKSTQRNYTFLALIALVALLIVTLLVTAIGGIIANVADGKDPDKKPPVSNASGKDIKWGDVTFTDAHTLTGPLVLVNASHKYVFPDVQPEKDENLEEISGVLLSNDARPYEQSGISKYMNKDALLALDRMLTDFAAKTGKKNTSIRAAYRTEEDQNKLYTDNPSATAPGYSDHHTGYGCALKYTKEGVGGSFDLASDTDYNQLYELASKYGFISRYPVGKEDKTGVSDYPEYFRYVGNAHAAYMTEKGLCLEEYIETLKTYTQSKPLEIKDADGVKYLVYYVSVSGNTAVKCPTNFAYTVSGTNEGGVVITVNLSEKAAPAESESDTAVSTETVADTSAAA